jgi:chromosome segregation and condensation protein ScpB
MSDEAALSTILEAILFSAGRSMSVDELMEQTKRTRGEVGGALSNLRATIRRRRDSALQLTEVSGRWIFEVRPTLSNHLPESVRPEVPQRLLPAAALIAYHQPMSQAQ